MHDKGKMNDSDMENEVLGEIAIDMLCHKGPDPQTVSTAYLILDQQNIHISLIW